MVYRVKGEGTSMASLALLVGVIILSIWVMAAGSLILTFAGLRLPGAFMGVISIVAGVWLLLVLPHAPILGLINIVAGGVAVRRYFVREET